jgi:hypothetical protein
LTLIAEPYDATPPEAENIVTLIRTEELTSKIEIDAALILLENRNWSVAGSNDVISVPGTNVWIVIAGPVNE